MLRELARGSAVGELARLTSSLHSASVRARRDSDLLRVTSAEFAELLKTEPQFSPPGHAHWRCSCRSAVGCRSRALHCRLTIAVVPLVDGPGARELAGESQSDRAALLDRRDRAGASGSVDAIGRRFAGRSVGLALSGGGAGPGDARPHLRERSDRGAPARARVREL